MKSVPPPASLSTTQALRYSRQILLPGFDLDKQERLLHSRVLMIGVGGLGCAAAQYLVAAGIGQLTLVDDDKVELSNLQRQLLHSETSIGEFKSESARSRLTQINSTVQLHTINRRLTDTELAEQITAHDIVLDCCDNLATRKQINAQCIAAAKPFVSGAAIRMEGQVCSFSAQPDQACYQCLSAMFGEQNLSCMEAGIMSPVVGIIGAMQALEAIKILTNYGKPLNNALLMFDAMTSEWRRFTLLKNAECGVCSPAQQTV